MSKVYHGDEWKRGKEPGPIKRKPLTRAQEQSRINALFALEKMDRDEWRRRTDELGSAHKWTAKGKINE